MLLLAATLLAVTACGPQVIEGRPPFISISDMRLADGTLTTSFGIANQNGVPMTIESMDITVTLGPTELVHFKRSQSLEIDANSSEEVRSVMEADTFTSNVLASLGSGELDSLAFDLAGRVNTLEDSTLRSEHTGYLYRVPGKPGQFRAAVTQAKGLVRDDPL